MKFLFTLVLTTATLFSFQGLAHEGHEVPGAAKSKHGGVVTQGKEFNMEMVVLGEKVEFFPLPHEGESLDFTALNLTLSGMPPKGKMAEMKLEKATKSFKGTLEYQKSYRLNLELKTDYKGKKDLFKFLAEK